MTTSFEERHRVDVRVGKRDYRKWQSATISYGLETAARTFAISATQPRKKGNPTDDPATTPPVPGLYVGDAIEVYVGTGRERVKLITGYTDAIAPSYDVGSTGIGISGRSKTADLVDCAAIGAKRFKNKTIEQIAAKLAAPYGVTVRTDLPPDETTGGPIKKFTVEQGEEVYEALERAARLRSLLITDNADGELVLVKAAPGSFPINLGHVFELGRNLLDGQATFDGSNVFSEYRCKGQRAGNDQDFGALVAGIQATATEGGIGRRRVRVLSSESGLTPAKAKARAEWEAANALGRSTLVNYTVRGWFDDSDSIWQPGQIYPISDPYLRIEAELLLVNVDLTIDDKQGHIAKLLLAPEAGYFARLPDNPRAGLGAWRSPV
jgi:prophage tail gpP-like protein